MRFLPALLLAAALALAVPARADAATVDVPGEIIEMSEEIGGMYCICPELLQAIAFRESSFDEGAVNGGCTGLMQVAAEWHGDRMERLGATDLTDGYQCMLVAADYLAELFREYEDVGLVLDVYSGNSKAKANYDAGRVSGYADDVLELSAALERAHGK